MAKYVKTEQGYQEIKEVNFNKMEANNPVGTGSFSMGRKPNTVIGINSHAEGYDTTASGNYSHAEGSRTTASGSDSHAEGFKTIASSAYSHAEGSGTTASSDCSHAEGSGTTASGSDSHAEGIRTTASSDYQHVQGKYNVEDSQGKYAHIVGNGTGSARSNAHTLDWNGNVWYAGDVYVGSTSGVNKDEGSKKLATEEYVDSKQDTLIQSGAAVGQIAKITAVDDTGKPTAWEAVDMPSGGGGVEIDISRQPDLILEVSEQVVSLSISEINGEPIDTTEMVVLWEHPGGAKYVPAYFRFNNEVKNSTVADTAIANFNLPDNVCPSASTAAAILCRVKKINNGTYWYEYSGLQQNVGTIKGGYQAVYGAPYRNNLIGETSIKEFFVYQSSNIQEGCKVSVWVK